MAVWTIRPLNKLAGNFVIGPERYDPRRHQLVESSGASACTLGDLVTLNRKTVNASTMVLQSCVVLDTSDAREGIITSLKAPISGKLIGSQKKVAAAGDVIISRLRPYLRQVAFVDEQVAAPEHRVVISTEFFVMRPLTAESIAFLVPFLLAEPVQRVLAVSQEGGHHPRFDESTLMKIPIPRDWISSRDEISKKVVDAIQLYRQHQQVLNELTSQATTALGAENPSTL